jgi:hypothetical protein
MFGTIAAVSKFGDIMIKIQKTLAWLTRGATEFIFGQGLRSPSNVFVDLWLITKGFMRMNVSKQCYFAFIPTRFKQL